MRPVFKFLVGLTAVSALVLSTARIYFSFHRDNDKSVTLQQGTQAGARMISRQVLDGVWHTVEGARVGLVTHKRSLSSCRQNKATSRSSWTSRSAIPS